MAKKEINEDLLSGAKISTDKKVKGKKAVKKANISVPQRTAKIIKSVVAVVVVIALLAAYVASGVVRKGFVASTGLPQKVFTGCTVTNGEQTAKIKVGTYNFYYANQYNSLKQSAQSNTSSLLGGLSASSTIDVDFDKKLSSQTYTDPETNEKMTWEDHVQDLVLDQIENVYTYYLAAVAENDGKEPEITDEQKEELESTIEDYTKNANKNGYTLSAFLTAAMGKGVTESLFRTELTRQYIAQNYQLGLAGEEVANQFTDDEINKYKDEHLDDLVSVDIRMFECNSEDEATAFKNELNDDGSNFAELASKYTNGEIEKQAYLDETYTNQFGVTKGMLKQSGAAIGQADSHTHEEGEEHSDDEQLTYSGLDWLFSSDRKSGDVNSFSTTVVYVITPASLQERKSVDVRHILIKVEAPEGEDTPTQKEWDAALSEAEDVVKQFNATDKTEDSFKGFVEKYSDDTGSVPDGGLIDDIKPGDSLVPSFLNWSVDNSRKAGDVAIVRSSYGYHIMYFVGQTDNVVWQNTVKTTLASDSATTKSEQLEEAYTISVNWFGSRYFSKDVDIDN